MKTMNSINKYFNFFLNSSSFDTYKYGKMFLTNKNKISPKNWRKCTLAMILANGPTVNNRIAIVII